jgi:hypothetical protein
MWNLFSEAAWRVALVSLVLGAGLPAVFAVGVRQLVIASGGGPGGDGSEATPGAPPSSATWHRVLGWLCFAVVVVAVVIGLSIIIASGLGKQVSFEHLIVPTFVDKG